MYLFSEHCFDQLTLYKIKNFVCRHITYKVTDFNNLNSLFKINSIKSKIEFIKGLNELRDILSLLLGI